MRSRFESLRGLAGHFFEEIAEIGRIGKPQFKADLFCVQIGKKEQPAGFGSDPFLDEFLGGFACKRLDRIVQVTRGYGQPSGVETDLMPACTVWVFSSLTSVQALLQMIRNSFRQAPIAW